MEKDLKDFQLIELLDIKSLLPDYSDKSDEDKEAKEVRNKAIAKIYDAIAKKLFNEYHIKKGDSTYDFLEIEFYYFDKGHKDYILIPAQSVKATGSSITAGWIYRLRVRVSKASKKQMNRKITSLEVY